MKLFKESSVKYEDFTRILLSVSQSVDKTRKEMAEAVRKSKQVASPVLGHSKRSSMYNDGSSSPLMEKGDLENAIRALKQGSGLRSKRRPQADDGEKAKDLTLTTEAIVRLQQQRKNLERSVQAKNIQ